MPEILALGSKIRESSVQGVSKREHGESDGQRHLTRDIIYNLLERKCLYYVIRWT